MNRRDVIRCVRRWVVMGRKNGGVKEDPVSKSELLVVNVSVQVFL